MISSGCLDSSISRIYVTFMIMREIFTFEKMFFEGPLKDRQPRSLLLNHEGFITAFSYIAGVSL